MQNLLFLLCQQLNNAIIQKMDTVLSGTFSWKQILL